MDIVEKDYQVTYDLVAKVGELRYQDHRQLGEIRAYLKCSKANIDLPLSTIAMIAKRYLILCKKLHEKNKDKISMDIKMNGGYILHFDGSTEQRSGKISFVLKDSLSGHILLSEMIKSENFAEVKVLLEKVRDLFGNPLVIVSDLRHWFILVCQEVFGPDALHILCHFHFLRTLKDLFVDDHMWIQNHLNHTCKLRLGIRSQLQLLKDEKVVGSGNRTSKTIEEIKKNWLDSGGALVAYQQTLSWILQFKQDSSGKGMPFDLPYLDFSRRFMIGKKLINEIFSDKKTTNPGMRLKFYHNGFLKILQKMNKDSEGGKELKQRVRQLDYSKKWFAKLRGALFMGATQENRDTLAPLSKRYGLTQEEASKIPNNIESYRKELKNEIACLNSKENKKQILSKFQKQVEKHQKNLKVPFITVAIDGETRIIIPPRTNNFLESSFRKDKATIRRQTGRSKLPREFGSVGALLPFYSSMKTHKTFKPYFENKEMLAKEFAKLAEDEWKIPENVVGLPQRPLSGQVEPDLPEILALEG